VAKFAIQTTRQFDEDYQYWQETDGKIVARINRLLVAIETDPFRGIGQPEPLRHDEYRHCWSRRIAKEHRLAKELGALPSAYSIRGELRCRNNRSIR
jgi:Txe/YoeB family toxin of toxin-antitoxin system